jgi:hypothetical protein
MTTSNIGGEVEEPVDETADATRLGDGPSNGMLEYRLLTPADKSALRMERAHELEASLYRIELALEEAADNAEREALGNRADQLLRRLRVHLTVLASVLPDNAHPDGRCPP